MLAFPPGFARPWQLTTLPVCESSTPMGLVEPGGQINRKGGKGELQKSLCQVPDLSPL